ncbi:hypothetical protein ACFFIX_11825 [Metabacillus herbersteinensis]|uniref:Uncharacterized protein n=1 Tax=Metabacillus herbersteinensis TaxID=283816 RepID=A0ABV6GEP2_9BACI
MTEEDNNFYQDDVFKQAQVVQHPKEATGSALLLTQSFNLLSGKDLSSRVDEE